MTRIVTLQCKYKHGLSYMKSMTSLSSTSNKRLCMHDQHAYVPTPPVHLTPRQTLHIMAASDLCKIFETGHDGLIFETQVGDIQRNIDVDHLSELKQHQIEYCKTYGHYSFTSQIVVAEYNQKYALVDGQHRMETLKYLLTVDFERAHTILVPVLIVKLSVVSEYDDVFVAVNKNKPVRLYKNLDDWKNVLKHLETYFHQHYSCYLKKTDRPVVPHINLDKLIKYIDEGDYIRKTGLTIEQWIHEIETLNTCYGLHWRDLIERKRYLPNVASWIHKCKTKNSHRPLYLGIYRHFEWVDRILLKVTQSERYPHYLTMPHIPLNYRKRIGKQLRRNVWKKRHMTAIMGPCYVCNKSIEFDEFECGHIVSVFSGGDTTINNLEPICKMCNSDMGTEHLTTFKEKLIAEGGQYTT